MDNLDPFFSLGFKDEKKPALISQGYDSQYISINTKFLILFVVCL